MPYRDLFENDIKIGLLESYFRVRSLFTSPQLQLGKSLCQRPCAKLEARSFTSEVGGSTLSSTKKREDVEWVNVWMDGWMDGWMSSSLYLRREMGVGRKFVHRSISHVYSQIRLNHWI